MYKLHYFVAFTKTRLIMINHITQYSRETFARHSQSQNNCIKYIFYYIIKEVQII